MFRDRFKKKREQSITWEPTPPQPLQAITIEGRRHRVDTPYILPQDDQERGRLDFQHYALREALGGDYKAPIEKEGTRTILDVGCGTGLWARERAREFPGALVTGVDIESHVPSLPHIPNFRFQPANVLNGLPFPDFSFDFVHQRLLVGAIPAMQWPAVLQELYRITRPDGWIEVLEAGIEYIHPGPATEQFREWWLAGEKPLGFNLALLPHLDRMLRNAGLRAIQMETLQLPLGRWGGRAGEMLAKDLHAIYTSLRAIYVSRLGVPATLFEKTLMALPEEWEQYQTRYEFYLVYGRK